MLKHTCSKTLLAERTDITVRSKTQCRGLDWCPAGPRAVAGSCRREAAGPSPAPRLSPSSTGCRTKGPPTTSLAPLASSRPGSPRSCRASAATWLPTQEREVRCGGPPPSERPALLHEARSFPACLCPSPSPLPALTCWLAPGEQKDHATLRWKRSASSPHL